MNGRDLSYSRSIRQVAPYCRGVRFADYNFFLLLFGSVSRSSLLRTTLSTSSSCGRLLLSDSVFCIFGNSITFFVRLSLIRTTGAGNHSSTGLNQYSLLVPGRLFSSMIFCSLAIDNPLSIVLRSQPVLAATLSDESVNVPPEIVR